MTRLRITRIRLFSQYLLYIVIIFCLFLIITNTFSVQSNNNGGTIITASIIGLIALLAAFNEYYSPAIEFDDDNMYLIRKKGIEEIPLKQVTAIKLTSNRVNNSHYWDIHYYSSSNGNNVAEILPKIKNFELFREKVKEKNPEVEIKESIIF